MSSGSMLKVELVLESQSEAGRELSIQHTPSNQPFFFTTPRKEPFDSGPHGASQANSQHLAQSNHLSFPFLHHTTPPHHTSLSNHTGLQTESHTTPIHPLPAPEAAQRQGPLNGPRHPDLRRCGPKEKRGQLTEVGMLIKEHPK